MHSISPVRLRRATWAMLALVATVSACDRAPETMAPTVVSTGLTIELEASSASATPGEQIAVAIAPRHARELGGLQGYLRYNPATLQYRGQIPDGRTYVLINANEADRGELRIGAISADGLGDRIGTLVFDVIGGGYAEGLVFELEEAATNRNITAINKASVARSVRVAPSLKTSGGVMMSLQDWGTHANIAVEEFVPLFVPGQIVPGLRYGDVNLSLGATPVTVSDALLALNASIGLQELIVGTDAPSTDLVIAANVFPANLPGLGEPGDALKPGAISATDPGEITLSDALAIINEAVGNDQPAVGELIPGRVAGATNRILVMADITTNTTWTKNNVYELQGNAGIRVSGGATLTIEPGTRVEGQRGAPGVNGGALFVQRDGRIIADGTVLEPIVLTCTGAGKFKGCWGGLVINGNAGINAGTLTSPAIPARGVAGGCLEAVGEGTSGNYGGCLDTDNSGTLRYVIVEYAGFRFNTTNELNGVALQGVGSGTIVDYLQVHGGLDDGLEFFGGTVNAKHIVLTANSDDSFDYTEGFKGKVQFVIVQHDPLDSDKGFEQDNNGTNNDAAPRSTPTIYNVTLVGKPDPTSTLGTPGNNSVGGIHARVGARPTIRNAIVQNFPFALDLDNTSTCVSDATGTLSIQNSLFTQSTRLDDADGSDPAGCGASEAAFLMAQAGNEFPATSPLLAPLNVVTPDWRPATGTAGGGATPPNDGFFDVTATYKGAVAPANSSKANIPWYAGWTRGWTNATTP